MAGSFCSSVPTLTQLRRHDHFGISEDRAVNYHSDSEGTQLNYEVVSEAICAVRCSAPLGADWKKRIDEDYNARKDGRRK